MTRVEIQEDPKKVKKVPDNKMKDKWQIIIIDLKAKIKIKIIMQQILKKEINLTQINQIYHKEINIMMNSLILFTWIYI